MNDGAMTLPARYRKFFGDKNMTLDRRADVTGKIAQKARAAASYLRGKRSAIADTLDEAADELDRLAGEVERLRMEIIAAIPPEAGATGGRTGAG